MEYTINEVFDIKEEQIYQANEFFSKSEHELMHWRRALEESILMGKPCFPLSSIACLWARWRLPHYRHSKRIPDEAGIHDTKRGKTIRKPLRPRIGYIHCGMMSDDGVNSPGLSQFG